MKTNLICATIALALFIIDMHHAGNKGEDGTPRDIFNDTIVGMMIGGSFSWIAAWVTFYTMDPVRNGNKS